MGRVCDLPRGQWSTNLSFAFPTATSPRVSSELEQARPQTSGEEELQLQLALAMSREVAEQVVPRPLSDALCWGAWGTVPHVLDVLPEIELLCYLLPPVGEGSYAKLYLGKVFRKLLPRKGQASQKCFPETLSQTWSSLTGPLQMS